MAKMGRPKGRADIAPEIRGAFKRACMMLDKEWADKLCDGNNALSLIIKNGLVERPLDTLRVINGFVPKEMLVEAEVKSTVEDMSDAELRAYTERLGEEIGIFVGVGGAQETTH